MAVAIVYTLISGTNCNVSYDSSDDWFPESRTQAAQEQVLQKQVGYDAVILVKGNHGPSNSPPFSGDRPSTLAFISDDSPYQQNKGDIDELPDSSKYSYKLETKTARKALDKVWKDPKARKEVLAGLKRIDKGELLPRNQKTFKACKTLNEIKFGKTRMLTQTGQNGGPDQIVAIFMRNDLEKIASIFKGIYP
jgi:hypothetical protein